MVGYRGKKKCPGKPIQAQCMRPYQRAYQGTDNSAWNDDDMIRIKHEEDGDNNDDGVVPREYQSMMIGLAEIEDR